MKSSPLPWLPWCALCACAGVAALLPSTTMASNDKKAVVDLVCRMSVPAMVASAKNVPLKFQISNRGKHAVNVLTWNTPLEGFYGKFLQITGPQGEVEYNGAMVKRASPMREDYVSIRAGATVTKTLNLGTAYELNTAGKYEVVFAGKLIDATTGKIPRGFTEHAGFEITCPPAKFELGRAGKS